MTGILVWQMASRFLPMGHYILPISMAIIMVVYIYQGIYKKQLINALTNNICLTLFVVQGGVWCVLSYLGMAGWFNLSRDFGVDLSYLPRQAYYFYFFPFIAVCAVIKKDNALEFLKKYNVEIAAVLYICYCIQSKTVEILNISDFLTLAFLSLLGNRKRKIDWMLAIALIIMPLHDYGGSTILLLKIMYIGLFAFKNAKWVMKLATFTIPVILVCSFALPQLSIVTDKIAEPNSKWRIDLWADDATAIIDSYGLGIGYGTTYASKQFTEPQSETDVNGLPRPFSANSQYTKEQRPFVTASHNSFVSIGLRMGVIGIALFCGLLFTIWKRLYKKRDDSQAAMVFLFCGVLIMIALNVGLESPNYFNPFMVAMGIISCHINSATDKGEKDKRKILHVVYGANDGGVEATIFNYYSQMDREKFKFDLVAQASIRDDIAQDMFAGKLKALGSAVCYIPPKAEGIVKAILNCKKIIKNGEYDIIHIHMGKASLPYVISAKLAGVKKVIVHTHIAHDTTGWSRQKSTVIMGKMLKLFKTDKFACSETAAKEMWQEDNVYIMHNALDLEKYRQDTSKSGIIKELLDLKGNTALCAVARFEESKNHTFLIEIFKEYLLLDKTAKLVLIGTGSTMAKVKNQAEKMEIDDRVLFLGTRNDVLDLLQGMDAFVLPSSFEGFGIAYVEAQLAGLPTFALEGAVSKEVKLGNGMIFMQKKATASEWAVEIEKAMKYKIDVDAVVESAKTKGLDIAQQVKKLEEYYFNM